MMLIQNRTYEYTMREPARDQAVMCLVDKPFRPVGFFVWGANQESLIRSVTIGVTRVPWCSNRPAWLFQPAAPLSIVAELALLDTGYTLAGWGIASTLSETYAPFPTVLPGTQMTVHFTGWAQSVLWWGVEPVQHRSRSSTPVPNLTLPSSSAGDDIDDHSPTEDLDSIVRQDPHELPDEPPDSEHGNE